MTFFALAAWFNIPTTNILYILLYALLMKYLLVYGGIYDGLSSSVRRDREAR